MEKKREVLFMPIIYLSPSTQENNYYVTGGTEEQYMKKIDDAAKLGEKQGSASGFADVMSGKK